MGQTRHVYAIILNPMGCLHHMGLQPFVRIPINTAVEQWAKI